MKLFKTSLLILIILNSSILYPQEKPRYGIMFGNGFNFHSTDFRSLPGVPNCCPKFKDGNSKGIIAGIEYDYPIYDYQLYLGLEVNYHDLSVLLESTESTTIYYQGIMQTGEFKHTINADIASLSFMPKLTYRVQPGILFNLGFSFDIPIKKDYSQEEVITKPEGQATFLDENGNDSKSMKRNQNSGTINNFSSLLYFINAGIGMEVPLNEKHTVMLVPSFNYSLGLNNLIKDYSWTESNFHAKLTLLYSPYPVRESIYRIEEKTIIDTITKPNKQINANVLAIGTGKLNYSENQNKDTIVISKTLQRTDTLYIPELANLKASITAYAVDSLGNEIDNPKFEIEEIVTKRNQLLLNYLFFDNLSSEIPKRYNVLKPEEVNNAAIKNMCGNNPIETYHNVLNIIGYRLKENPKANIIIKGCNSNIGGENANLNLSRERANSIAKYLNSVWSISYERIKVTAQNLPDNSSYPTSQIEKQEENRRVEFYSDDYNILAPIYVDEITTNVYPTTLRLKINTDSSSEISNWNVDLVNKFDTGNLLSNVDGRNTPPDKIDFSIDTLLSNSNKSADSIYYSLSLKDKKGNNLQTKKKAIELNRITIENKKSSKSGDYKYEKYNLILFDFTSDILSPQNLKTIDLIKKNISENSEVEILGYTDNTGDSADNKKLSLNRAETVFKSIGIKQALVKGIGEDVLLYDNTIPEGRFYCRTVEISIKTPINK